MFRLSQTNVLKTRVANQVVSNARNSLNHSIRFNSVALERSASTEFNNNTNSGSSFTKTIKEVASQNNRGNKKTSNFKYQGQRSSPWFNQLAAFEDCVNQTTDFNPSGNLPFFWDGAKRAMDLYHELRSTPDFDEYLVTKLAHLLHNGLRANRFQLARLAKKPDYDSRSFHSEMDFFVKSSVREIVSDLLENKITITENGAMHLLTSLKEMKLDQETIGVWTAAMSNPNLKDLFLKPRVVGIVLPLMYEAGSPFEDLNNLFQESKKSTPVLHQNLAIGMIRTCLAANENTQALELFTELCTKATNVKIPYLIEAHLTFIGTCKDTTIASSFFEKAISKEMPYHINLQVNAVKTYLTNIWESSQNFEKIVQDWTKANKFYGRNIHHGISSSLNNVFFDLFFIRYRDDQTAGLNRLKELISTYNEIKPIDEPFFNIIISKCGVWKDKSIVDTLYKAYDIYNIKKSEVSRRIYLKALGSVATTDEEILSAWYDLLRFSDSKSATFIANADWAALRDATVTSQIKYRPLLYAQVFKKYSPYCRDVGQYKRIKQTAERSPETIELFEHLETVDDSNVELIKFNSIRNNIRSF